jgi:hypothetical protein
LYGAGTKSHLRGGKEMNQPRISEIEKALNETVTKNIAKTAEGYISRDDNGNIIFVKDPQKAAVLSNSFLRKISKFSYQIEKAEFSALSFFERSMLEDELKALKSGHGSASEMREYEQGQKEKDFNNKKAMCENSIFKNLVGDDFYKAAGFDFCFQIEKMIKSIAHEAVRQGAELYHTSREGKKETSFYLKKNGVKIRISDHELPQIMHRTDMDYNTSWDKEVVIENNRAIWSIVEIKTEKEFSAYVEKLFTEE